MNQIIEAVVAIVFGVGGMLAYYFGSNLLIDRVFGDIPPSFSAADFLALVSAAIMLIAFLFLPWVSITETILVADAPVETSTTYTALTLFSAESEEKTDLRNTLDILKFGLILLPFAAIFGMFFAAWGMFTPIARGTSAVGTASSGLVAFVYYLLYLARSGQSELTFVSESGFIVGLFATVALVLQVVIVRPLYTPPPSEIVVKVNTSVRQRVRPWLFVMPALLVMGMYLVYPTINTLIVSLYDKRSVNYVGLRNYDWAFGNSTMQQALGNNLLWLLLVPSFSVIFGLLVAILADRVPWESFAKSLIFMPMAISFVGASVVWKFVYETKPAGEPQIGLLNAVVTAFGGDPVAWIETTTRPLNNIFLIIILVWIQAGFAMVLLSAALKAVPEETIEAARIDGANELQVFFGIIIPQIMGTIVVVTTTIVIVVLKVFDIVYTMTSGRYDTDVLANLMYSKMFTSGSFGRGSAIAIILMVAVLPVMYYNIRSFRREEATR